MFEIEFDPEVYVIEDEIINYFLSSPVFSQRDPLFIRILMLFLTRKYLTQATLKDITKMSAGKISEEVNNLLELDFIKIAEKTKKGKLTYQAKSAGLVILHITRTTIDRLVKWEEELVAQLEELEDKKGELEHLNGYKRLHENTKYFVELISQYKDKLDILDAYIKSLKND